MYFLLKMVLCVYQRVPCQNLTKELLLRFVVHAFQHFVRTNVLMPLDSDQSRLVGFDSTGPRVWGESSDFVFMMRYSIYNIDLYYILYLLYTMR